MKLLTLRVALAKAKWRVKDLSLSTYDESRAKGQRKVGYKTINSMLDEFPDTMKIGTARRIVDAMEGFELIIGIRETEKGDTDG